MLLLAPHAGAVDAGQRFEDPAAQLRYERLIDLRCPSVAAKALPTPMRRSPRNSGAKSRR
jgi:hypothetical protein